MNRANSMGAFGQDRSELELEASLVRHNAFPWESPIQNGPGDRWESLKDGASLLSYFLRTSFAMSAKAIRNPRERAILVENNAPQSPEIQISLISPMKKVVTKMVAISPRAVAKNSPKSGSSLVPHRQFIGAKGNRHLSPGGKDGFEAIALDEVVRSPQPVSDKGIDRPLPIRGSR